MKPEIHLMRDGMDVHELEVAAPEVFNLMLQKGFGKLDQNQTVQFCGLVAPPHSEPAIFVPKGFPEATSLHQCKVIMRVLAKYGAETTKRELEDDVDAGTTGLLSVISKLASDFRENGFFTERQRLAFRNIGKPNWPKTINRTIPLGATEGQPVHAELLTSRAIDTRETLLGRIHAAVLRELCDVHGWWLEGISARRSEFQRIPAPLSSRRIWASQVRQLLSELYASRSIRLANLLIDYLETDRVHASGSLIFGLNDFHSVWERMLASTLPNVLPHKNEQLPFARYQPNETHVKHVDRFMRTDIIAEEAGTFYLLDAKYYLAQDERTLPGWGDVAKQIVYEQALRKVIASEAEVVNAFVFPSDHSRAMPFKHVGMTHRSETECSGFPTIRMYGINVSEVMSCYTAGTRMDALSRCFPASAA